MSKTYGFVNLIASLGFTIIWRRVVFSKIAQSPAKIVVVDLMTGMGELFHDLRHDMRKQKLNIERVEAVDFSSKMCERAREEARKNPFPTNVTQADIFDQTIPDDTADVLVCSFGLKTFSTEQQQRLAKEVRRLLKPGGQFSFIEISMPKGWVLRCLYRFYIGIIIPIVGKMCLGNPDNYRMLGVYTTNFGNSRNFESYLKAEGLEAHYFEHFFGCASGVYGQKR